MLPFYYLFLIPLPETDRHTKFADEQPSIKKNFSAYDYYTMQIFSLKIL